MSCQRLTYPLLPLSRLVYDSTRWWRGVYMFSRTERIAGGAGDLERWRGAVRMALLNHPVFSARIDRHGRQYATHPEDIMHGPYHRFSFRKDGDDLLLDVRMGRILGDGRSVDILREDIWRAYHGEPLEQDDYWGYLEYVEQQKLSEHYRNSRDWLINEFSDVSIPVHPITDRRLWTVLPPKAGLLKADYADLRDKINHLAETEFLSMDGFFSLCAALAIAEYCGTESAALTWAYEGRERPEEQRIFGSLHRDIPFQIKNLKSEKIVPFKGKEIRNQKSDLIRQARNQIRSGIAHSDYPYTLTAPYNKRWNYAVNVLRVPDDIPPQKYAYALLDVEIHESEDTLALWFRYSATHYKESSVRRFAALVRKYAEWLLKNNLGYLEHLV